MILSGFAALGSLTRVPLARRAAFKTSFRRLGTPLLISGLVMALGAIPAGAAPDAAPELQDLPATYQLTFRAVSPSGRGAARLKLNLSAAGEGYALAVDPDDVTLSKLGAGGREERLAAGGTGLTDARVHPVTINLIRRNGSLDVLEDDRLIMDVEDDSFSGGNGSVSTTGDAAVTDLRVQPLEAIYFTDDFMRQPKEPGEWTYESPGWEIQTVGIVERGANPFSLECSPHPTALASTGYSFWNNYAFEVAAKGSQGSVIGACVGLKDARNYYLFRWSEGPTGAMELQRVVDGKSTTLARSAGGFIPGIWYLLRVSLTGGRLVAEVDNQAALTARDTTFGEGKIGLYSAGGGQKTWFDSVLVRPAGVVYDDFSQPQLHRWDAVGDRAIGGSPEWSDYTVTVEARGPGSIPFRFKDVQNYYLFSWAPSGCKLMAVENGDRRTIAETTDGVSAGANHSIVVDARGGYFSASVDGVKVVEGLDFGIGAGRAGFEPADAGGGAVKSAAIHVTPPPEPTDALTPEFTEVSRHPDMQDWAGPLHDWNPGQIDGQRGFWHRGRLFGDTIVQVPLANSILKSAHFELLLNVESQTPSTGYTLEYVGGNSGADLTLRREGQTIASGRLKFAAGMDAPALEVAREGAFVYARMGSQIPIRYRDPHPLDGYHLASNLTGDAGGHSQLGIALFAGGAGIDVPAIRVINPNTYAETFHLAPINWRPQSGSWQVSSRWSCQPGWTWYGGRNRGYAVNWYKRKMMGDQAIDYYTAAVMADSPAGSETWRDLNCAFCSDGSHLFSGYTVIIGGWNDTVNRLYRKGKMVAESRTFQFPPAGAAHRSWFGVHIVKQGGQISVEVEGRTILSWTDPDPLTGGYTCFWTYDNGMMLARAVLSSEEQEPAPLYTAQPLWLAREPANARYPESPDANLTADLTIPDHRDATWQDSPQFIAHNAPFQPAFIQKMAPAGALRTARVLPPRVRAQKRTAAPRAVPNPARPGVTALAGAPFELTANGMTVTVEPGGTLSRVRFGGREVLRRVVLDIRSAAWHEVKLTPENAQVKVVQGLHPGVRVRFQVRRPDLGMKLDGREYIEIRPGGVLIVRAAFDPKSDFESNRLSVNLVIPAAEYTGRSFAAKADGAPRAIHVPTAPLYPIQFATNIQRLAFTGPNIRILPDDGVGVLEDLRHYDMDEFWYEQQAPYHYPQVTRGDARTVGVEAQFGDQMASRR